MCKYKNNGNAIETAKKVSSVCVCVCVCVCVWDHHVRNWFWKFCFGDTSLSDKARVERPSDPDQNAFKGLVEWNPHISPQEFSVGLITSQSIKSRSGKS